MARGQEPLLAGRPSSEHSRSDEEEDALLTGLPTQRERTLQRWSFWREVGLFIWAFLATVAVIIFAIVFQHQGQTGGPKTGHTGGPGWHKPIGKRNLVFMVSDGMGPTSLSMTRSFRQYTSGLPIDDVLVLDQHFIGTSRTRSSSSLVTDSAAGATAFSCGKKSYNGAISVTPDHDPCGTVLEAAKKAGYTTGLVVTTRITDATPACFASHVNRREYEDRIAEQELGYGHPMGSVVDLMLGGGRCHFLPNTTDGSCRADGLDLVTIAQEEKDFTYISDRKGFDGLNPDGGVKLPLLGLFANGDIPYEIDRRFQKDVYPSLAEMTTTALKTLKEATKDSDKGFFIMIEASRIDHAGHSNDPAAQVHEVLAYDEAFAAVLKFLDEDETEGVLVATSDHETGGLAAARQLHETYPHYHWFPSVLANATHSVEFAYREFKKYLSESGSSSRDTQRDYVRSKIIESLLGLYDVTDAEIDSLLDADPTYLASWRLADILSRRAQIGWSTHGHSAVDVNIYASSRHGARPLAGNHENTEVGKFLAAYLEVDVEAVTEELKDAAAYAVATGEKMEGWMGPPLEEDVNTDHLDHYHGEYRKREIQEEVRAGAVRMEVRRA